MEVRGLRRVEPVLEVLLVLRLAVALRRAVVHLPRFIVAGSLVLPLLLVVGHCEVVLDQRARRHRRIEFRHVLRRVNPRLLLQVTVYRVLVLTVSSVVAREVLGGDGAA